MKKTLFLSAILAAALCSSAFGIDQTFTGSSSGGMNVENSGETDTITFQLNPNAGTGQGQGNWFASAKTTAAKINIEDDAATEGVVEGLNISNGNRNTYVTFSGAVSGNGSISKIGNGENLAFNFTGNVTEYTGDITLGATATFVLRFGSTSNAQSEAGTAPTTSATKGVSGTGDITFTSGSNTVIYNYAAATEPVYITNAIKKSGGTSNVQLLGAASYVLTKDASIDNLTIANGSSLKYTGSTQLTYGGQVAADSTLEGVVTNNVSNVKYTGTYGVGSGTLKNVQIHMFDAGATEGSITLNGVYGNIKNGGTQRNITLTGDGLRLTEGYTGGSYSFQKLDGSGDLEKRFSGNNETFTFQNATEWTGKFVNTGGSANVIFNGNSNADVIAKGTTNVTLKGTNYSDMHIKAFNGNTAKVTVQNSTSDVTIEQLINDPSGRTSDGTLNVIVETAGHKVIVEEWATVNSITLKNGSSIKLNNHNVGTLTMESGSGTVTSGANIGSGQHGITNLAIGEDATLTLGNVATVTTVTGAAGTLNVNKNLTVTGLSTIGTLSVSGGSTITLQNHNVSKVTVTGGSNKLFSNVGVGSDINHRIAAVDVNAGASLTFGTAATTVGAITLGTGSLLTVGDKGSHNYALTTDKLTVAGNAGINANLVVSDNGTMDFSNHTELTMGCTVTIGDHVTIKIDDSELASIVNTGSVMTIINDVEGVDMDNLALTLGSGWKFVDAQGNSLDAYNLRLDVVNAGDGKVNIVVAPEPATATLSLLALAALASRRKRH